MSDDARAALLGGLIDYAGLFPPAGLALDAALAEYDHDERGPDRTLLGRFVLPAARLGDLAPWLAGPWTERRPLRLVVLATREELAPTAAFAAATAAVRVEALELRAPDTDALAGWLDEVLGAGAWPGGQRVEVHVELAPGRDRELLAALAARRSRTGRRLGAKLRCGGVTADLVPPVARVAAVVAAARDLAVPLKFTAGLHHPVRGMDRTGETPMHGFLNVYGAGLLAHDRGLDAAALARVVAETDPAAFRLDRDAFAWRDLAVPAARVARLRAELLGGYGSCSFREPVADLRSLALLT